MKEKLTKNIPVLKLTIKKILSNRMRKDFKTHLFDFFVLVELLLLTLGASLPIASIDEFWFFTSEFSIFSLALTLLESKEYILSLIIITFGFILPVIKVIQKMYNVQIFEKLPLYKFSMIDMFLLSFLIFGGKLSYFYEVNLQLGFYFLAGSIFLNYSLIFFNDKSKD